MDNKFAYEGETGTHQWYDGTPHPWEFKRVWHLEPSLTDPDTVYAGVEDAALFRSTDGGQTWQELPGLRTHGSGQLWQPGAGGMCLHTIILDPSEPEANLHRHLGRGRFPHRRRRQRPGSRSTGACSLPTSMPDPTAEVGHCVHRIAMHPSRPDVLFMQKHWDVMRSDDAGDTWHEVSGNLPTDFGFVDRRSRARAGNDLRRADQERLGALSARRQAARLSQPHGRQRVGAAHQGLAAKQLLRQRAARCDGRSTRSIRAACISAPPAGRSTLRPMPATTGRRSSAICRPCCPSKCRRCHDPRRPAVRICGRWRKSTAKCKFDVEAPVTQRAVLDALEARYPMLRGTIRDHVTHERRPFCVFSPARRICPTNRPTPPCPKP